MADKKIPHRDEISAADKWDLSPLFKTDRDWEELFSTVSQKIGKFDEFRGRLHESVEVFFTAIEFDFRLSRDLDRLYTYAHLKSDEDKSNAHCLGMHQRAANLGVRAGEASSFMGPEILAMESRTVEEFMADPRLATYRFYLEKLLRARPHTLNSSEEKLLAMTMEMALAPSQVFGQLDNVDMSFGTIVSADGEEMELSHGNFILFLNQPQREIRKQAFFQYYRSYDAHKHTLAASLGASTRNDTFYARARRHGSSRQAALFSDNVPEAVYDNLIDTVRKNLSPLFAYLDFRKEVLALDELHFYDTYVPLVGSVDFQLSYDEAVATCIEALAPLGREYTDILEKGLRGGWVDRYENRGKRSGAYSSGCYDSPPYILMNYQPESINSLYTLIHEAGHSMHSYFSKQAQDFANHGYTIFVAEVASTFNETLLSAHLLEKYRNDPRMTAYILNRDIDNIRATLFRQTMFAEFEKRIHALADDNQPLTLETFRGIYAELLAGHFGSHLVVDPELELECLRIPHFYRAFYVYKYATGISAALALARRVMADEPGAKTAYLDFLASGGSAFPLDQLTAAGVDMATALPVETAIGHFDQTVQRLMQARDGF